MKFHRHPHPEQTFSPEEHRWLAQHGDLFLFVLKTTDRWSPSVPGFSNFIPVPKDEVPVQVRRKAGQRLGAFRRNQ